MQSQALRNVLVLPAFQGTYKAFDWLRWRGAVITQFLYPSWMYFFWFGSDWSILWKKNNIFKLCFQQLVGRHQAKGIFEVLTVKAKLLSHFETSMVVTTSDQPISQNVNESSKKVGKYMYVLGYDFSWSTRIKSLC